MKRKFLAVGIVLALSVFLVSGCVGGAPGNETGAIEEPQETVNETEETPQNDTGTEEQGSQIGENKIEAANSLAFKVESTKGETVDKHRFKIKNIGKENMKLRAYTYSLDPSIDYEKEYTMILDKGEEKGWKIEDGETKKISEIPLDFSDHWSSEKQMKFDTYKLELSSALDQGDWESGDYTYHVDWSNTTVSIYDIKINPDFSNSVFQPS